MGQFNLYWGIVAEDKVANSRIAKIYIKEFLPFFSGDLDDHDGTEDFKVTTEDGESEELSMTTSIHTPCEWFGFDSNRTFPPDLVKGEQVRVIQYADSEVYYWESSGRDDGLRRDEIFRQSIANRKNIEEGLDDDNTYFFEMDTKFNKRIRLVLNNSDGEDHSYTICIDGKESFISLNDDIGNRIILESNVPRIKLVNSSGTFIDLHDQDITMVAPRDIIMKAGRQIVQQSQNMTNNASTAILHSAPNVGLEGTSVTTKASTIGIEGAFKVKGHSKLSTVTAESYAVAGAGAAYPHTTTDVGSGGGSTNAPAPDTSAPSDNRHCAAQEQMLAMAALITQCFAEVKGECGQPSSHAGITPLAITSKMNLNTGE